MTSDTNRPTPRRPACVALLAALALAGCGDSGEKKTQAPDQPQTRQPQPQPKGQKLPPGGVKME